MIKKQASTLQPHRSVRQVRRMEPTNVAVSPSARHSCACLRFLSWCQFQMFIAYPRDTVEHRLELRRAMGQLAVPTFAMSYKLNSTRSICFQNLRHSKVALWGGRSDHYKVCKSFRSCEAGKKVGRRLRGGGIRQARAGTDTWKIVVPVGSSVLL